MKFLKPNKRRTTNLLFLLLVILPSTFTFMSTKYKIITIQSSNDNLPIEINPLNLISSKSSASSWNIMVKNYDRNSNWIIDASESELNINQKSDGKARIIIQFPDNHDYSIALAIFENNGGIIKHTYKYAINGFAGEISKNKLDVFYNQLRQNNIEFLIEEDSYVESTMYHASLSMNLRPYVWNTLNGGYKGDSESSIAILDTGLDMNNEYFDNYSTGSNFNYKVIDWFDAIDGLPNFYDDNGHGSHCAGIAAGMGTPVKDAQVRTVATASVNFSDPGWSYYGSGYITVSSFNVTSTGRLGIICNYTDYTFGSDEVDGSARLYRGGALIDSTPVGTNWQNNITTWISTNELGIYTLRLYVTFKGLDGYADNPRFRFKGEIHYPFDSPTHGSGNVWQGVAPEAHLVGVKVLDDDGRGLDSQIIAGIDFCINNKIPNNITVMSMSLGGASTGALITAVNNAVNNGIVTVVAAGNEGIGGDNVGSPGDADKVITVAAMNYLDQLTSYSSQGGSSNPKNNTKPDITAPGGSSSKLQIFSADTGFDDGEGAYSFDGFANDTMPAQGTSMATPAVAGAANLLIEAMGGANKWDWSSDVKARLVKSILLMTATETYPLAREGGSSPPLNRGGKDVHEGYGRMNIDAAIEAWTNNLTDYLLQLKPIRANITSSYRNPYGKHAFAGYVNLKAGQWYIFNATVPGGKDYDMHLYNSSSDEYGEPKLIWSKISDTKGRDEIINYTATVDGKYFLVIKAIGPDLPATAEEDDDGDDDDDKAWDLVGFLLSPLGLLLVVGLVAAVIILIVYAARGKREEYTYIPDYSY